MVIGEQTNFEKHRRLLLLNSIISVEFLIETSMPCDILLISFKSLTILFTFCFCNLVTLFILKKKIRLSFDHLTKIKSVNSNILKLISSEIEHTYTCARIAIRSMKIQITYNQ